MNLLRILGNATCQIQTLSNEGADISYSTLFHHHDFSILFLCAKYVCCCHFTISLPLTIRRFCRWLKYTLMKMPAHFTWKPYWHKHANNHFHYVFFFCFASFIRLCAYTSDTMCARREYIAIFRANTNFLRSLFSISLTDLSFSWCVWWTGDKRVCMCVRVLFL